ncbi:MAG: DJ-1/PfpI family protein [Gudongella sp.]|nr:DJ-1/PfpI family protein [Gudongella sp.]
MNKMTVNIVLFNDFETLDAFGPIEIFGTLRDEFDLRFISESGGEVKSVHGVKILTEPFSSFKSNEILFIPGGMGVRGLVENKTYVDLLRDFSNASKYILTVCTGSALLGKTGLLNHKAATSNKIAFDWVKSIAPAVDWQENARWSVDDKYYTSSGVSAGMDMALGFIRDIFSREKADKAAKYIEYIWNDNPDYDPFSLK